MKTAQTTTRPELRSALSLVGAALGLLLAGGFDAQPAFAQARMAPAGSLDTAPSAFAPQGATSAAQQERADLGRGGVVLDAQNRPGGQAGEISDHPADLPRLAEVGSRAPLAEVASPRAPVLRAKNRVQTPAPGAPQPTRPGARITVTSCDRLASDPGDPRRIAPGVERELVDSRLAIRDCAAAVAADPDNPRLNFLFGRALDVAERFDEARDFYQRAADRQYAAALFGLGFMHRTGRGAPVDETRAAEYYLWAATLGMAGARSAIAWMYADGRGVAQSTDEMLRWLELAAADHYPPALDYLGTLYRRGDLVARDLDRAVALYRRAAAQGEDNAIANLARAYRDGDGVRKNLLEAVRLYEDAIQLGNAFAPYHLGRILLAGGEGVPRDPERARLLLEMSAERGFEWALWALGRGYERGQFGAPADAETALYYMIIAAEVGGVVGTRGGDKLALEAAEKRDALRAKLTAGAASSAEGRASIWLRQNSLLTFAAAYDR